MKKGLILLPLLALAVTACTSTGGGSKKKKSTTHETGLTTHDSSSSGSQSSGSSSGSKSSSSSVAPTPGQAHDVPWLLEAESMYDPNAKGYAAYEGDHAVEGTNINFHDVLITDNPAGDSHTGSEKAYAFQFSGSKSRDPGVMTISSIKAVGSIEAKILIEKSHGWTDTQIGKLTFGNGTITVPGTSTSVVSDYDANWNLHTVEIPVNATAEGDFVISNTNVFAFYIVSLHFKA